MLLQLVREVSRRQIAQRARQHTAAGTFPADLFALLAELDLLGLPFAPADGGGGHPTSVVCDVLVELSRSFVAVGLGMSVHLLATAVVAGHARPSLRADVLPRLIAGELLASCALPPPTATSEAVRAERDGDVYVLDGRQASVTHAGQADCYVLFCATAGDPPERPTPLFVPADAGGLECLQGTTGAPTGVVVCRDLRVPVAHRLGDADDGHDIAEDVFAVHRLGVAACAVGLSRAALHPAVVAVRSGWGDAAARPVAARVAGLAATVEAADALVQRAAAARDTGRRASTVAAMAMDVATATAARVAEAAVRIDARAGSVSPHPLARYRREAGILQQLEHDRDAALLGIAQDIVGDVEDER